MTNIHREWSVHQISHTGERNNEISTFPNHNNMRHVTQQQLKYNKNYYKLSFIKSAFCNASVR